jgi:hypothetical protein
VVIQDKQEIGGKQYQCSRCLALYEAVDPEGKEEVAAANDDDGTIDLDPFILRYDT